MISRRSLFSFLAGAPVGAVKAAAEARAVDPPLIVVGPEFPPDHVFTSGAAHIVWTDPNYNEMRGAAAKRGWFYA